MTNAARNRATSAGMRPIQQALFLLFACEVPGELDIWWRKVWAWFWPGHPSRSRQAFARGIFRIAETAWLSYWTATNCAKITHLTASVNHAHVRSPSKIDRSSTCPHNRECPLRKSYLSNIRRIRNSILTQGIRNMLIYGYSPFEAIYSYNTKNGLYEVKQLKPLLHEYTWILADRHGDFCGFEQRIPHTKPLILQKRFTASWWSTFCSTLTS